MKFKILILTTLFALPIVCNATTDWTPILRPLLNGCDFAHEIDDVSKLYKSSVVKDTLVADYPDEEETPTHHTLLLKDAVAFGQPITKITNDESDGSFAYSLYFKNTEFMKLRPLFKLPKPNSYSKGKIKTSKLGYETEDRALTFDVKQKTITCSGYQS